MSRDWSERESHGSCAEAQGPELRSAAAYAAWRPAMDAWLESHGAGGVHVREMTPKQWQTARDSVEQWGQDAVDAADFLLFGSRAERSSAGDRVSSSGDTTGRSSGLTPEVLRARETMTQLVQTSVGVYGAIYSALPLELRPQIEMAVGSGFAYGLWKWLEEKYQSTEQDRVSELLTQWIETEQGEEESVDAYRARVDKLHALLMHAGEKPSARMYSHIMADKLQPRYAPAVLALKAAGTLKDADRVAVLAVLNSYERKEAAASEAYAIATRGRAANEAGAKPARNSKPEAHSSGTESERGSLACVRSYGCDSFGHSQWDCSERARNQRANDGARAAQRGSGGSSSRCEQKKTTVDGSLEAPCRLLSGSKMDKENARRDLAREPDAVQDCSEQDWNHAAEVIWGPEETESKAASSRYFDDYSSLFDCDVCCADSGCECELPATRLVSQERNHVAETAETKTAAAAATLDPRRPMTFAERKVEENPWRDSGPNTDGAHAKPAALTMTEVAVRSQTRTVVRGTQADLGAGPEQASAALKNGDGIWDDTPNVEALLRMHVRLGHLGFDDMIKLVRSGRVRGLERIALTQSVMTKTREIVRGCEACSFGRRGRQIYDHRGLEDGTAPLEALHLETFMVRCQGRDGLPSVLYGATVRDTFSGEGWCVEASTKDRMEAELIDAIIWIGRQCDGRIRRISCDGRSMLASVRLKDWMQKQRVSFRVCMPMDLKQSEGAVSTTERRDTELTKTLLEYAAAPE
jgi:hypothetical protein